MNEEQKKILNKYVSSISHEESWHQTTLPVTVHFKQDVSVNADEWGKLKVLFLKADINIGDSRDYLIQAERTGGYKVNANLMKHMKRPLDEIKASLIDKEAPDLNASEVELLGSVNDESKSLSL